MTSNTIKVNQPSQMEGSYLKKIVRDSKVDESVFEGFISSLLSKISNNTYCEDDGKASPNKEINELLQGLAYSALHTSGIGDIISSTGTSLENGTVNAALSEHMLSLTEDEGSLLNKTIYNDKGILTIDNLSEYALKVLEDLQQNDSHEEIQSLSEKMYYTPEVNDAEIFRNLLKKYSIIEDNIEDVGEESRDFRQIEKKAMVFEETKNLPQDKKGSSTDESYGRNEHNQLKDMLVNDTLQDIKSNELTDEKSAVNFKMPEINSGADYLNVQTLSQTETHERIPRVLELTQENIDKIVKSFKTLRLPDSTEINVKLTPEELGEVSIRVVLEKGHVTGHITAESKEVALMLENKLDILKQEMAQKNVKLSEISVSVFTGQGDGNSQHSSREFQNKHGRWTQNSRGYIEETAINHGDEHDTGLNIIA